ncbi:hypothetical protein BHM03_00019822 [Ensete ventricosum]|nr:hypothetical protein BHM03_00019822 [Ensete ventricosum]
MARPLPSQGREDMVGSKGVIKKVEFVRIITKALYSLGYERSGAVLEEESGIPLHSSAVDIFRKQVLEGNWDESVITLQKIGLDDENILKSASFLILEQKFLELLGKNRVMEALDTLRSDITPLSINKRRTARYWAVREDGELTLKHKLSGHLKPVLMVAWSPDDSQLLTCGMEEVVRRWDVQSGECLHVYEKNGLGLISCGWFPDGKELFSGVTDRTICFWDMDGKELDSWKGQRTSKTSDVAVTKDGRHMISLCRETVILLLDRETKTERLIEEEQIITSFSLSKDDKFLLINLINQEIHLWNIKDDPKLVTRYIGHKRSRFLIRSCFGGTEQAFIASGSEDSQVCNCDYRHYELYTSITLN